MHARCLTANKRSAARSFSAASTAAAAFVVPAWLLSSFKQCSTPISFAVLSQLRLGACRPASQISTEYEIKERERERERERE
jgi:hypothetical protein